MKRPARSELFTGCFDKSHCLSRLLHVSCERVCRAQDLQCVITTRSVSTLTANLSARRGTLPTTATKRSALPKPDSLKFFRYLLTCHGQRTLRVLSHCTSKPHSSNLVLRWHNCAQCHHVVQRECLQVQDQSLQIPQMIQLTFVSILLIAVTMSSKF